MSSLLKHASLLALTVLLCGGCTALKIAIDVASREAMSRGHEDSLYPLEDVDGHDGSPALSNERRAMYIRINKLAADGKLRIELIDGAVYMGRGLHVWADSTLFQIIEKEVEVERMATTGPRSVKRMRAVDPEWTMVSTGDIVRVTAPPPKGRVRAGQLAGGLVGMAAFAGIMTLVTDNTTGTDDWGVPWGDVLVVALVGTATIGVGAVAGGAIASNREVFELKTPALVPEIQETVDPD